MRHRDAEVLIVGAGPAGSTLAFYLARAGVDVLLVDRARFPRDKPCSEYLSPQASRLLHELQALDAIEDGPFARLTGMRVVAPDGSAFEGSFAAVRDFRAFSDYGLAVRRPRLDAILLDRARAAGARVLEGLDVRDLVREGGAVAGVEARDGERRVTLLAPVTVGADGLRSVVARRARLGRHGRWPRRMAFVSHAAGVRLDGDVGEMHVFPGGYAGFAPVGGGLTNLALVVPADHAVDTRGDATAFMRRGFASRPALARRLDGAEWEESARAVGPFNWRAPTAWAPGMALVGDAADFFDPFTGEGIYAAMRSAELLVTYACEAARAPDRRRANVALAAWDRSRREEFRGKWMVERVVATVIANPTLMNRAARAFVRRPDLAHTLVGVTGDFVPPSEVFRARYILSLLAGALAPAADHGTPTSGRGAPHAAMLDPGS